MHKPVLLIRAEGNEGDAAAIEALGFTTEADPYLSITAVPGQAGFDAAAALLTDLDSLGEGDWLIATSLNGLKFWGMTAWELTVSQGAGRSAVAEGMAAAAKRGVRFAAIGKVTAQKYSQFGIDDVFVPSAAYGEALAAELIAEAGSGPHRALIPAGNLAMQTLTDLLTEAGWEVISHVIYETAPVAVTPQSAAGVAAGEYSAVVLRSPSAARALIELAGNVNVPVVCGGRTTGAEAARLGICTVCVAVSPTPENLALTVKNLLEGN